MKWNAVVVIAGVCVIALLIYFLVANFRYRQRLINLASLDGLTGLANRRRIAQVAQAALDAANSTGRPLCIAIIDMDHFKVINDRSPSRRRSLCNCWCCHRRKRARDEVAADDLSR